MLMIFLSLSDSLENMKYRKLCINNEFSQLKTVFMAMASIKNSYTEISSEEIIAQQISFINILKKHGVDIIWADIVQDAKYQIFTRDPFIVIGDILVLSHMSEKMRLSEPAGAQSLLNTIDPAKVIYTPQDIAVEGGDVIPHGEKLFVGQDGTRTDKTGLEFLKKNFGGKFDIIPIHMRNTMKEQALLHLDCVFNPVWHDTALVSPDGVKDGSLYAIEDIFSDIITVPEKQRDELGINVFSPGNKTVIVQERHPYIAGELKSKSFTIEYLNSYATTNIGGYCRCMTCPIERD